MQTLKDIVSFLALLCFIAALRGAGIIIADRQLVQVAEARQ